MIIFNGRKLADEILDNLEREIKKSGMSLKLAAVLVGRNPASELFIKIKKITAKRIGIKIVERRFSVDAKEKDILDQIGRLNKNSEINGIIVQLPLPGKFNAEKIVGEILSEKDVDGFGKNSRFLPPLISAILTVLEKAARKIKRKKILALVNSDIFGETLKRFFKKEKLKINYLLCKDAIARKDDVKKADIIITACGNPKFIKRDMLKKGVVLIDAGIVVSDSGKVVGDIDKESALEKAAFLTPVPGGIGPLTVAFLLKNVYLAELRKAERRLRKGIH